jgi:hypothetical protein
MDCRGREPTQRSVVESVSFFWKKTLHSGETAGAEVGRAVNADPVRIFGQTGSAARGLEHPSNEIRIKLRNLYKGSVRAPIAAKPPRVTVRASNQAYICTV